MFHLLCLWEVIFQRSFEEFCAFLCHPDNRKDALLHQLTKSGTRFSIINEKLCEVQERIKSLELAMKKAREIRRVPDLEQYCSLDKVANVCIKTGRFSSVVHVGFIVTCCLKFPYSFWRHSKRLLTRNLSWSKAAMWTLDWGLHVCWHCFFFYWVWWLFFQKGPDSVFPLDCHY